MTDTSERDDDEPHSQFSVFEGDLVNRGFAKLGLGSRRPLHLLGRSLVLISITWLPMAILALFTPLASDASTAQNFFRDFAAYTQFFSASRCSSWPSGSLHGTCVRPRRISRTAAS